MVRSDLVLAIARDNPDLTFGDAQKVVDVFFNQIVLALAGDGRVEVRGFGTFVTRSRAAREGRDPRTGQTVSICAKRVPFYKPSKEWRGRLSGSIGQFAAIEPRRWRKPRATRD
ncbi:HU family DNA-binding protein [Sphingomonas qomolangmaensis]|uniref:Integration host factor subunit beta n=1 Tax=Sphingomonas qomolangmaensis TaxID=2918765 RepID=A0ABY5LBL2_9SPHN|nr:HU family DNA-binding protein [Sphingomonas qomolangmaensis]UUL83797.1 integration host factor subunit beta [Sphingomonas qomolangmaensis]